MTVRRIAVAATWSSLVLGCAAEPDDTGEIVDNLVEAGFPADDIMIVDGAVYVGRDAQVSLTASREMLRGRDSSKEQYRTWNVVGSDVTKICIDGGTFSGAFGTALDRAIDNYNQLALQFSMARLPSVGCGAVITAVITDGAPGGDSGFPSDGRPYGTLNIHGLTVLFGVDTLTHVITHELGHTIGLRHSDYYDRSISCGGQRVDEGQAGIGAILLPETPSSATPGGSVMNSCFGFETGRFTETDTTALITLYPGPQIWRTALWTSSFGNAGGWDTSPTFWATLDYPDVNGDGRADVCGRGAGGISCAVAGNGAFIGGGLWSPEFSDATGWAPAESYWRTIRYVDVNGDGRADVCGRGAGGIVCALSTGSSFAPSTLWTAGFSDAGGWGSNPAYWGTIQFADVNGDGRADVCGRGAGGIICAVSTGSSFGPAMLWTAGFSDAGGWGSTQSYWGTIRFADVNGDGRADVCGRGAGGVSCALSTGSAFGPVTLWTGDYSDTGGRGSTQSYWGTIGFPDVNGDHRADVCGRGAGGMVCAVSTGGGFGPATLWTSGYSDTGGWGSQSMYWSTIAYADVNGDGRDDVCGRGAGGMVCAVSTGGGFGAPALWTRSYRDGSAWTASQSNWGTIRFPDIDGDGHADICGRAASGLLCAH